MSQLDECLPRKWASTTLGEVTTPRGLRIKPSEMPDAPFIGLEHVEAHTMRLIATAKSKDLKSSASYFSRGDVIYGRLRPYLNKVHAPDFTGLASGEFIVFPIHQHLNNAYLKYFLNHWEFVSFVTRLNTGDRPRVDFSQFADYPFPFPPLAEQRRIVAEIETQFTRLDASVAALRRVQANLKRYRASVLKAACEGSLVPTEAELARSEGRGLRTSRRPAGAHPGRAPRPVGVAGEAAGQVPGTLRPRHLRTAGGLGVGEFGSIGVYRYWLDAVDLQG